MRLWSVFVLGCVHALVDRLVCEGYTEMMMLRLLLLGNADTHWPHLVTAAGEAPSLGLEDESL